MLPNLDFYSRLPFRRRPPSLAPPPRRHPPPSSWWIKRPRTAVVDSEFRPQILESTPTAGETAANFALKGFCQTSARIFLHQPPPPPLNRSHRREAPFCQDMAPRTPSTDGVLNVIQFAFFFTCQCLFSHAAISTTAFLPAAASSLFSQKKGASLFHFNSAEWMSVYAPARHLTHEQLFKNLLISNLYREKALK